MATNIPAPYALYQDGDDLYISALDNGIYKVDLTASIPQMAEQILSGFSVAGRVVKDYEMFFSWFLGSVIRKFDLTEENPSPKIVISGLDGLDGKAQFTKPDVIQQ